MSNSVVYTAGGTVQADGGTYLTRSADDELLQLCQGGRFTYVLTARQMGKSSLMIATANNLEVQGICTAVIDLTQIGKETTKREKEEQKEEWYFSFLVVLAGELGLEDKLTEYWESHSSLILTLRFTRFFKEVVLAEIGAPIVVFVDEIDSTLSLDFTDDFFIAIRYFYTARAQNPAFNRLSFVLVGVATPSELISNQNRTPFNIGERVDLTDFTFEEALPLAGGLGLPVVEAQQVLQWVLEWTGGHPYLTLRLCKEIAAQDQSIWTEAEVEALTGQLFLGDNREQDPNLQFVRDMLICRIPNSDAAGVIETYLQIYRKKVPVPDEDQSVVKANLKLSGVVKREGRHLVVRNTIYSKVFNLAWIAEQLPEPQWKRPNTLVSDSAARNLVVFTTGGTVQASPGIYLSRQADSQLLQLCQQGTFTYVLTPRQMGKSSLMVATANTLRQQGMCPIIIDMTQIVSQIITAEEWYLGLLILLAHELQLNAQLQEFWESHNTLSITHRFTRFFEEVVLVEIEVPIVVFVDEIDSILNLEFTDAFFIAIRYFYTARAEKPAFNRLSFVLLGVATPSELISDKNRTPFNIGQRVDLTDFTFGEALPLAGGLGLPQAEAQQVLRWVLEWTGGHPYLTQRLCKEVQSTTEQGQTTWAKADVEALTEQLFFGDKREQDNNLQFVQDMLIRRTPGEDVLGVLSTYRQIRQGRQPVLDEDQSVVKAHLKLSGVVKQEGRHLVVRNNIYSKVFDTRWIREQWPETWWKRLKPAMPLIAGLSAAAVAMSGLAWYANTQRLNAIAAIIEAETERDRARKAEALAEKRLVEVIKAREEVKRFQQQLESVQN